LKNTLHLVSASLLGVVAASCSEAPPAQAKKVETPYRARGEAAALQLSLAVEAVDVDRRLITLRGPGGNVGVYKVGEEVKRLSEIQAGQTITAEYKVAALAELREPTAAEKDSPLVVVEGGERDTLAPLPAAALGRAVRVVTTIEALDRSGKTLTVKGPLGGVVTLQVEDPAAFEHLQIGKSIVVTFAEALRLSVAGAPVKKG
jgi:hypothetical protein